MIVDYCDIYLTDGICNQCQSNMALSENHKYCFASPSILSNTDTNCRQARLLDVPVCVACAAGYYWQDGYCKSCDSLVPGLGCLICSPYDEVECLVCAPGFYMNDKGECVVGNVDSFDPNSYSNEGVWVLYIEMLSVVWLNVSL